MKIVSKQNLFYCFLDFLLESVLDDPALNEPGRLLALARRFVQERLG